MKTKKLHRNLHPVHWHGSMYLAIAAILVSMTKTSHDMLKYIEQAPVQQVNAYNDIYLREAENIHMPVLLASGIRHATLSGK